LQASLSQDLLQDAFRVYEHVAIGKTQYLQALRFQITVTFRIAEDSIVGIMLTAIQFNYQACFGTEKIHDVVADDFLPIELQTANLFSAKPFS
jgi:hypothetical protein